MATDTIRDPFPLNTARLRLQAAGPNDAAFIVSLWTDPRVMGFVGFPLGLPTSEEHVLRQITDTSEDPFSRLLTVVRAANQQRVGQARVGRVDAEGIVEPDIKLAPTFWNIGYGQEVWRTLILCGFLQPACRIVQGTPNVENAGSIHMMERSGMRRSGERTFQPSGAMEEAMVPVHHYIYRMTRQEWEEQRKDQDTTRRVSQ